MPDGEKQPRSNGTALGQGLGSPSRPLGRLIRDTMRAKLLQLFPTP